MFLLFFATSFSILYQGYYFGQNDTSIYVPYLKSLSNNSLYPDDLMVNTWKSVYPANLWKLLVFLSQIFPLEKLLLCLHILFRFFFFLILYMLSFEIFRNKKLAYISVVLWFIPKPTLGFDIFYNEFVQSSVVFPILLLSILMFVRSKYILSALILGIAFHIHPPMSGFMFISILLYLLYKRQFFHIVQFSFVTLLIAFPIIISIFILSKNKTGYDSVWVELTRIRSFDHSFPFSWPKEIWISFILFTVSIIASIKFLYSGFTKQMGKALFLLIPLALTIIAAVIFSEVVPIPKAIITVPFHISSIFAVIASFAVIYAIYKLTQYKKTSSRIVGYLFFIFFFFNNFSFNVSKSELLVVGICISLFLLFHILKFSKLKIPTQNIYFFIFLTPLLLWIPFMVKSNFMRVDSYQQSWEDVQKWSKSHTNKSDMFIVPIYLSGFRVYSERPIVADWKDGSIGYLSPQYLKKWWFRMTEFGLDKNNYSSTYQKAMYLNLNETKVQQLAKKYNANYFITERKRKYELPVDYINQYFIIYNIFRYKL